MDIPKITYLEIIEKPSIKKELVPILQASSEPYWIDPIICYLQEGVLLEDKVDAKKLRHRSALFMVVDGKLYIRAYSMPLLHCIHSLEANFALQDVHEGIYGGHVGGYALAYKIMRQGYYWLSILKDAMEYVQCCDCRQRHAHIQHQPIVHLSFLCSPWPFT